MNKKQNQRSDRKLGNSNLVRDRKVKLGGRTGAILMMGDNGKVREITNPGSVRWVVVFSTLPAHTKKSSLITEN